MSKYDNFYKYMNKVAEDQKRTNFNAFMTGLDAGLVKDLNDAYASGDIVKYNQLVNNIKSKGIRVFRNDEGRHKLRFD